jgi:hypothetical protein
VTLGRLRFKMSDIEDDEDGKYYAVSFGWLDYIPKLPKPVFAWPGTELWRAMVHGHGFVIEAQGFARPIHGFYTTYFVRAKNRMEAAEAARRTARKRWENSVPGALASGDLLVEVDEVESVEGRFRWRSGAGYTFYGDE